MEVKQGISDTAADFSTSLSAGTERSLLGSAVETWIVIDRGKPIGRFYLDMHPRPGNYSQPERPRYSMASAANNC